MATRSTIAVKHDDGTVTSIYCHWDGYISNNGNILNEHYRDSAKVNDLMQLGDISSLGSEIGEQHPFDNPHHWGTPEHDAFAKAHQNMCSAYGRDRGEEDVSARTWANVLDWINEAAEQFNYMFDGSDWFVNDGETDDQGYPVFTELEAAILLESKED